MNDERDWADIRPQSVTAIGEAGWGMLRITLLFGSLAIAVALFLTPLLDRDGSTRFAASSIYGGIDRTATGTARGVQGRNQYTIRRSILQTDPGGVCIIHSNGAKSGNC
ncbi:hypothetical protein [Oricola sp.]|uniref:hypothetical protein n=1 Tax=Oricola sp. TaxID=1979950 RepID=UPI003BACA0D9